MDYLAYVIVIIIGVVIGIIFEKTSMTKKLMGRLRIDRSEPDEPARLFLELKNVTPDMIAKYDFVTFKVINEDYLSRD